MNIALIGGLDRNATRFAELSAATGHTVECHTGITAGRGQESMAAVIDRSDVVVIVTELNSHSGVWAAKKLAKARGRRCVLVRRIGQTKLKSLLAELPEAEGDCRPMTLRTSSLAHASV